MKFMDYFVGIFMPVQLTICLHFIRKDRVETLAGDLGTFLLLKLIGEPDNRVPITSAEADISEKAEDTWLKFHVFMVQSSK